jgi:hypothetical protein
VKRFSAQTPQAFTRQVLAEAITQGSALGVATDEVRWPNAWGILFAFFDGDPANIKITTTHDLRVSEALPAPSALSSSPQLSSYRYRVMIFTDSAGPKLILAESRFRTSSTRGTFDADA